MKLQIKHIILWSVLAVGAYLILLPSRAQDLKKNNEIIVAYYGRPGVSSLGVLGQHSPSELAGIIKKKVREYEALVPGTRVIPGFDIIYDMATAAPGADHSYTAGLSHEKLEPYLKMAEEEGFQLFIDMQLGNSSPLNSVKKVLKYLKYKNVHIAIDPEFEVLGLGKAPGKVIGHIDGEDVNKVQQAMVEYLKKNNITETKKLIVHMFTHKMVRNKTAVKNYSGIDLIMNLDGHGSPQLKVNTYNGLYTDAANARVDGGFKLFFGEDKPRLMTPKQVLGMESVSGVRIKHMPRFVNYQ